MKVALHHQKVLNYPEKISKIKPYINKYNLDGMNFTLHLKNWKFFESNNKSIACNVLVAENKKVEIKELQFKA